jgi:hypothetical protein
MKTAILVSSFALFLVGCASDDSGEVDRTQRFGKPESSIPWNQPTDWERGGQLGSNPAFQQPH